MTIPKIVTYGATSSHRILGIGQGSGGRPSIWTAILDRILWLVSEKYESFIIETPQKDIITQLVDAYIDYASQITTNHPKYHSQTLPKYNSQSICL